MIANVIVKFLYEDLLMPDDTHPARARKRLIAFIAPIGILRLLWALFDFSFSKVAFSTNNEVLKLLFRVAISMSILILWGTTRYKRAVTDAMGNAFLLVINLLILALVLDPNTAIEGVLLGCCSP